MNNHEGSLKKYFVQAREQSSLLSADEARTIILQAGHPQKTKVQGTGSRGVLVTFVIAAAVIATFIALPHSNNDAVTPDAQAVASTTGIAGNGHTEALATPATQQAGQERGKEGINRSAFTEKQTAQRGESIAAIIEQKATTSALNMLPAFAWENSDVDLPSFSIAELAHNVAEVSDNLAELQTSIEPVALPDQKSLGYTVARTNLSPLPEVKMVPGKIVISPLMGLNTPYYDDYNPMITADGRTLYFISNREHGLGGHDFWVAHKKNREDLPFSEPQNLGSGINTSRDEGSASISADGQTMYFTGCHRPDGLGECDIYEARLEEEGWIEVRNLYEINSRYWEAQPTISADGRALYFVSNRPGVMGDHEDADIYVSYKTADGTWSKPENVGSPINTKKREDSPFIAPGGDALYFSSAGHKGMGGLDFYVAHKGENGEWKNPENLGPAFNTPNDERFITLPAAEDVIYFASADGKGGLDLFMARREASSSSIVLNGNIVDAESGKNLNAHLLFVDGETGAVLAGTRTNDKTEEFSLVIGENSRDRVVYVYGITDSLGEFRARLELPSANSYREYRCNFVLGSTQAATSYVGGEWTPELPITTGASQDQIILNPSKEEWGELAVLDAWGHQLVEKFIKSDTPEQIDLSKAPDGIYLIRLGQQMAVIPIDRRASGSTYR